MNMATFDLNLLKVLDALLREGTTVGAGARIGLSQPAVSAALGRLRAALGDPLFVRKGARLQPTDFARALAGPLREHLDALARTLAGPAPFDPATARAAFRLSGADFFADMLMPGLAARVAREAPGVTLSLIDLVPQDHAATLERDLVDLALIPRLEFPEWMDWRPAFHSSFAMVARAGHPRLAGVPAGAAVPLDLFCDLSHALMSPEGRTRAQVDAALAAVGRERRVVLTLPVFGGVLRAVAASDLVAMVPRQLALAMAPGLGLAVHAAPVPVPVPLMCMTWARRSTATPAHRWLRRLVAEALAPLNAGEAPLPG